MSELWDDSALITAFNSAMTKYKDMHGLSGKSKYCGQKACNGETKTENSHSRSPMKNSEDQGEVEKDEWLEEVEAFEVETSNCQEQVEASVQEHDAPLDENSAEKTYAGGHEELETSGYHAEWRNQERQHLMSQLQKLEQQQQQLSQQLLYLGTSSSEQDATSAAWNNYSSSQYCSSGFLHQTYPPMGQYCSTCLPYHWNAYCTAPGPSCSLSSPALWSNGGQCQHCTTCKPCGTAAASQQGENASNLPETISFAVTEAMKAAGIDNDSSGDVSTEAKNNAGETQQNLPTGLSDVARAWFLAGFHTSRYLAGRGATQ